MEKIFGATERRDSLIVHGTRKAVLIFGYGEENGQGYDFRHTFTHAPTKDEVLAVIVAHINEKTGDKILSGYKWQGKPVWLSSENQLNWNADYERAVRTDAANLPLKYKIGEDAEGNPVYHKFTTLSAFTDFHDKYLAYIHQCLTEGWEEKDKARAWVATIM